nr:glycine-rich cell wall structural protein 1.8-like [Aegilops tauschii subsp. strangulata]
MAHRGGVEDWLSGGHLGCGFGTEAPWAAGAEGRGGGFLLSALRQRAEGQPVQRAAEDGWAVAGVGTCDGEYWDGGGEVGGGAGTLARGPARGKPKKSDQGRAAGTSHGEVRGAGEGRQGLTGEGWERRGVAGNLRGRKRGRRCWGRRFGALPVA